MRVLGLCKGHGPNFQKTLGSSHPSRSPHLSWWAPSGELPSHWTEEQTAGSSWPDPKIAVPLGDSLGVSSSLHSQSTGDLAEYLSRTLPALRRRPQVARYGTCWASVWVLRTQVVLEQHPNAPGSPSWSSQRWSNYLKYMRMVCHCSPRKTSSMQGWNVLGAEQSPKGILVYSYRPYLVMKAVLGMSDSAMAICQYPDWRSRVVKNRAPPRLSKHMLILGKG